MTFNNPTFLWALGLLAIPILIHLFNFRRYKKVIFSNVEMLSELVTESKKTRQIKKWLVLLTRMLAIACLVLAFAQPYKAQKGQTEGRQLVSIYIDNSQSMAAEGEEGQLFENTKNRARQIVASLPNTADVQFINNGLSAYSNKIYTPDRVGKLIDDMDLDFHPNNLKKVVQRAQNKFLADGYSRSHVFALSDFQGLKSVEATEVDSAMQIHLVRMQPSDLENLSIDSVWLTEPVSRPGSPIQLKVKITNNGTGTVESSSLVLKVNGVQQGVESFGIAGLESQVLQMSFTSANEGWVDGELSITDVPVVFDNQYFFSVRLKSKIAVLQVGSRSQAVSNVFVEDPSFSYTQTVVGSVDFSSLSTYDFIILNELTSIGSGFVEQIKQFVEAGGIVLIVPNVSDVADVNMLSKTLGVASYGALQNRGLSVSADDLKKPLFRDVYRKIPRNTLLPKVNKSLQMNMQPLSSKLLSIRDGSALLVQTKVDKGNVFQMSAPLSSAYSNLANHELFVLSMLKMAFSKVEKQELAHYVHSNESIALPFSGSASVLKLVKKERETILETSVQNGQTRIWLNEDVDAAGVYDVATESNETVAKLALNYNRAESRQKFAKDDELSSLFAGAKVELLQGNTASIQSATNQLNGGTPLWKLFMGLCLLFLLIEVLLLRFLK